MREDFRQFLVNKAEEEQKLGKIIVISGISGSGKNFIADRFVEQYNCIMINKYVTRPFRENEIYGKREGKDIGIKAVRGEYNDGEKSVSDQASLAEMRKQAFLKLRLPFAYINYDNYYGFSSDEINSYVEHGRDVVIIVNDIGVIRDLKSIYGGSCIVCYVYRVNPNNKDIFMQIAGQRHDTTESAEARQREAVKDFNTYSNNTALYDYTILNTEFGMEATSKMLDNIISRDISSIKTEKRKKQNKPKLYAYIGSQGSGKDDALEIIRVQGMLHSIIVPKCTTRQRRKDDGEEMICPGDTRFDMESCDIQYTNYGTIYGINSNEIRQRLNDGISSSIVVSNEDALRELEKRFPSELVRIFIQGLSKQEYILQQQGHLEEPYVASRIKEYEQADDFYQRNLDKINHVIINAGDSKDLRMQIDNIVNSYESDNIYSIEELRRYLDTAKQYISKFSEGISQEDVQK